MGQLRDWWRQWVFDPTQPPVGWTTHPHDAFKVLARAGCAFLGSIVPVGLTFLRSGLPRQLDNGTAELGWLFWGVVVVLVAIWLISVIAATASEEKSLVKYIFAGTVGSANLTLVLLVIQSVE